MRASRLPRTPLQQVLGFDVAEEIYDLLPMTSQIIIDLKIMGYTNHDIAECLGLPYTTVYDEFKRAQITLATSKLKQILDNRLHYRENHPIVLTQD